MNGYIQSTEISSNKNSLKIITEGLNRSPIARHDSKVTFSKNLRKEEIADWVYNRNIDVLTLEGTFSVGDQQVSVFLGDLASFDAPLADVIESQLMNYHKTAISDIINDLIDKHKVEKNGEKKSNLGRQIADLQKSLNNEVTWRAATIIADYGELYDLTTANEMVKEVLVRKQNNAVLFDEQWSQPGKAKKSIYEIKPHPKRNLPGSLEISPDKSSALMDLTGLDNIKAFSLKLAEGALEALIPSAHAAGSLCGNKPGETFCPPDGNFEPDNPLWYVYIAQPYADPSDYLQGVSYTLVDWSSTELKAFTDTTTNHCRPVLTGTSANCRTLIGTLQEDVIYVPDSTYEAETEIPNPSCSFRTGTRTIDFWAGCFSAYYAISNFPSPYLDTTIFDDFDTYSATLGTYNGASLSSSTSYYNYIYFDARGETIPVLTGKTVRTRGQIGTRIPSSCTNPFCVFGVDTTKTIDSAPLLPVIL